MNPYVDDASNNEKANINTKTVYPGQKLFTKYGWILEIKNNIQTVGVSDDYEDDKVDINVADIKDMMASQVMM
ncbi:MAG: hypothetical protein ACLTOX_05605 [Streptococcus thermophilus]